MPPKLSQEEFDEAVKTNIEDFDMEAEEAVASAIEEFKLQGYSLEGIIKSSSGGNTDSHPVSVATKALAAAASGADPQPAALQQSLSALQQQFKGLSSSDMQQALAVANKEGTVAALLATAKAAERLSSSTPAADEAAPSDLAASVLIPSFRSLRLLMQLPDCRASFLAAGGPALLLQLLQRCCAALSTAQQADDKLQQQQQYQLAAAVAALVEAAAWQDEDAKCILMQDGWAAAALTLLQHIGSTHAVQSVPPALAGAAASAAAYACGTLRACTTADDERPPASKAFLHARLLAGPPHNALGVLLPVLVQLASCTPLPAGPLAAVMAAVRQIAANDDICKSFAEAGGVSALLQLLSTATEAGPPELVRGAAAALRQLANSDSIKAQLAEEGVLPVLFRAVRVYTQPGVQEALLGLLVALVLRMPDISTAAAEAGAVEALTEVLTAAPAMAAAAAKARAAGSGSNGSNGAPASKDTAAATVTDQDAEELAHRVFGVGIGSNGSNGGGSAAAVQRQACMAVRNMVVRNPELRPGFLAAGCEGLLRAVKGLHPGACKDVASAALRDLGLDNYNDL